MRLPRFLVVTVAVLALASAGALAQTPPEPLGPPLFPGFLVSHATDGVGPDGARTRTDLFVTNAGRGPLAAELAFVPDTGLPVSLLPLPAIAPGATAHVLVRAIVGPAAPAFVSGTVRVQFFRPELPPAPAATTELPPEPPMGVISAYLTTSVASAPGVPAPPPLTIPLDVRPLHPLADHPPCPNGICPPPPCPADHPCPGPDHACVPAPDAQCELPACPADHPCPSPDHRCVPPEGAVCGPQVCPADHPCPTPDQPCVPPPGANCGSLSFKGVRVIGAH